MERSGRDLAGTSGDQWGPGGDEARGRFQAEAVADCGRNRSRDRRERPQGAGETGENGDGGQDGNQPATESGRAGGGVTGTLKPALIPY
jgi:hypothetical protein